MKIGIIHEQLYRNAPTHQNACKKAKKIGFDGFDYSICGDWATPRPIFSEGRENWVKYYTEERKIIEGEGLKVFQTHATLRSDFDADNLYFFSPKVVDQFKREIEATAILGSKYIVIHPINIAVLKKNKQLDFERNMTEFAKLTSTLKEFGVKNAIEDMFTWDDQYRCNVTTGCSTPDDMVKYIDGLNDRDAFCACLDTGHMLIHRISPADAVRTLGDRLEVLHVHENNGHTDQHLPIGFGITDWEDFMKALKEVNYKGVFSLELTLNNFTKCGADAFWKFLDFSYASAKNVLDKYK